MFHIKFEHMKGTENILADHISQLRSMGLYKVLDSKEGGKEFGHFMFNEYPPISAELERLNTSVNQI